MQRRRWLDFTIYLAVRVVVCVVQALSVDACAVMCRRLAWVLNDVVRLRRSVVDDNLRHAYPNLSPAARHDLARRMWEHLLLLGVEMAHAPRKIHRTNWRDYFDLVRRDLIIEALFSERPVVMLSAHYGNFELSGYLLGLYGFPSFAIARPLDNPYLDRFVNQFRGAQGQFIIAKNGSARQVDALLARKGTLGLLADQHAGPKGCWVDFFNRPASTHKAIALFALTNDAPLLLCYSQRIGKPLVHNIGVEAMIDVRKLAPHLLSVPAMTQWYTASLERIIRRAPEQYWWVHRRWKDGRPQRNPAPVPSTAATSTGQSQHDQAA